MGIHKLNEIVYNKSWETDKNRIYQEKLKEEFLKLTPTSSHCPLSWSPEVYKFFKNIEKEYGLLYEYHIYNYLRSNASLKDNFLSLWWNLFQKPFLQKFFEKEIPPYLQASEKLKYHKNEKARERYQEKLENLKKFRKKTFRKAWLSFFDMMKPNIKRFIHNRKTLLKHKNPIILGQFKEKFCYLTFYNHPLKKDETLVNEINEKIAELEIVLSQKNAYRPLKELIQNDLHNKIYQKMIRDINKKNFLNNL